MPTCTAYGCTNSTRKKLDGISFHKFPHNKEMISVWKKAMHLQNWTPSKHTRICSAHFEDKYINRTMDVIRLKDEAVPTIFSKYQSYLESDDDDDEALNKIALKKKRKLMEADVLKIDDQVDTDRKHSNTSEITNEEQKEKIENSITPESKESTNDEESESDLKSATTKNKLNILKELKRFRTMAAVRLKKVNALKQKNEAYKRRIAKLEKILKTIVEDGS